MKYEVYMDDELLYYPNDKEYAISGEELDEAMNDAGTFTFDIPITNPRYNDIRNRASMIRIMQDGKESFCGEVREAEEVLEGIKSVYVVGELSFLFDSIQPQKRYQNYTPLQFFTELINEHNSQVEEKKRFEIGIVTVTDSNDSIYRYTNREDTLTAIREKLCDKLNGYLRIRKENGVRYLDIVKLEDYGKTVSQPIELGYNLTKYIKRTSGTEIATQLIPLGAKLETSEVEGMDAYVDIKSVNDGKDYISIPEAVAEFGVIRKVNYWRDVTVPSNLKAKGEEWLKSKQYESLTLELTAVDLAAYDSNIDYYEVGDYANTIAVPYGMDAWFPVYKKKTYLQEPDKNEITLSNSTLKKSYTQSTQQQIEQVQSSIPQQSAIQNLINQMAEFITGYKGGNLIITYNDEGKPNGFMIMDTDNQSTAKKILWLNLRGITYSSNGVKGPFDMVFSFEQGGFAAGWIVAGILSDVTGKNYWDLDKGLLNITNGILSVSGQVVFKAGDYTSADLDTAQNIILGAIEITPEYLAKYDFDGKGYIGTTDLLRIRNFINGNETEHTLDISIEINGLAQNNIIKTNGVSVGKNGMYSKNMTTDRFMAKSIRTIDSEGNERIGMSGTFTVEGTTIRVVNGIIYQIY